MADGWRGVSLAAADVLFDGQGRLLLVHQNSEDSELFRHFTLDPSRDYQQEGS
jgi:hypothetical protein